MSEIMEQNYYKEPIEAKYIRQGTGKLLDVFFYEVNRLKLNQYILTADEAGIGQLEKEFEILPNLATEALDFRRQRILNRTITKPPFTLDFMCRRLDDLCGIGKYDTELEYNKYQLKIRLELAIENLYEEVELTVKRMVPANMNLIVELKYRRHKEMAAYNHRELKFYTYRELKELVPIMLCANRALSKYRHNQLTETTNRQITRKESLA